MSAAASATWLSGRRRRRLVGEAEERGQNECAQRAEGERRQDRREGRLGLVERERLVVARVVFGDVHADREVGGAVDRCVLDTGSAGAHRVDEAFGEVANRMQHAGAGPRCAGIGSAQDGESVGVGAEFVVEEHPDAARVDGELLPHQIGVVEGLLASGGLVVGQEVVACEPVRDTDEHEAGKQSDEREEQRDAGAQAECSGPSHRSSVACRVARGSPAAGGMPGGGRHPTGAA